ncbi:hypothetical protein C1645_803731 [Glomus cerebriforme]|uniref:BTB/POZ domain-containing protein n=1 Tax=Glomus cerebriforme TaxID=658196 RepID=A0A397T6Y6_9GLOM|nr:hypothetical protein C1645_803731 [Glomus cerebriforme]
MEAESLLQLSYDIGKLLENGENYDMIVQIGTGNNIKEIKVHSIILYARSLYFRTALSKNWISKEGGIIKFKKPNISPKIFNFILRYLYTGKLEFNNYKPIELILILVAADELNIEGIIRYLSQHLIDNHQKFLQQDPVNILQIILQHDACSPLKELREYCLDYVCERPTLLFDSEKYLSLDKNLLLILLSRNDLIMDEIEVWKYLIKWSVAQISTTLNIENLSNWSSKDFSLVKESILEFIPLIRWFSISSIEFNQHVIPFEKILPKDLIMEIKRYHLDSKPKLSLPNLPARKEPLDSILINQKHLSVISSWIDRKDIDYLRIPYAFKLLFRATRDGFNTEKFHELCDYKGAVFVVISLPNSTNLIGGYNPLDWKPKFNKSKSYENNWWKTSESFLFSLTKNTSKGIIRSISRVNPLKSDKAILYNEQFGPGFGSGPDLALSNNQLYCKSHHTYPDSRLFISEGLTKMEDYEVFQIIRKK